MGYPVENSISPLWEAFPLASKGRPKPSLRDLSRLPMDVNSYFDELTAESDRACALIAAAAVADGLRDLIYQYCFNISKEEYEHIFYSQNAVLGSLANRAEIAKALGLISPEEYGAISVIRRVRNEFSHSMAQFTFDNELIRAELDKLSNFLTKIGDAELPKTMFIRASMSIYLFLSHRCGYLYNKTGGLAIPIPIYREATPTPSPEK
jgi:DNA-binding MltR family transcriptional regulator